jgi:hypothetical protein
MADAWLLVAPTRALPALRPLLDAHAAVRPVMVRTPDEPWGAALNEAAGVLVIGDRRRSPRTAQPGLFMEDTGGRRVPAGWLPAVSNGGLERFAAAAATVQRRRGRPGPIVLLGQWDDQVVRTVERSLTLLETGTLAGPKCFWWTADRIVRRDLLTALRVGPGLALYFGHGRPYGWSGYHGLHTRHLAHARGEPLGAVLSVTCSTASRRKGALSFSESIPLGGVAAAALGATAPTRTTDNWRLGLRLCAVLAEGAATSIGELLIRAGSVQGRWTIGPDYRLLGDPLAPLAGAVGAAEACAGIWAPAPDAEPFPPAAMNSIAGIVPATASGGTDGYRQD